MIKIPRFLRRKIALTLLTSIQKGDHRVLVIAVTAKHVHVLVELPRDPRSAKRIVGRWKCARTAAIRAALPGAVWSAGGKYKPVTTRAHQRAAFDYIKDDQGSGAWVWTYRDGVPLSDDKANATQHNARRTRHLGKRDS